MSKTRCVLSNNEHVMLKRQAAQLLISDAASLPYHAAPEPHPLTPSYLLLVLLYPAICCAFIEKEQDKMCVIKWACHKRRAALLSNSDVSSLPYHAAREPHPLTPSYLLFLLLYPAICCAFKEKEQDKMCAIKWACHVEAAARLSNSDLSSLPHHAAPEPRPQIPSYVLLVLLFAGRLKSRSNIRCLLERGRFNVAGSSII